MALNAGEGAFHWIRCHTAPGCDGWIFDCGTRSRRAALTRSIRACAATLRGGPAAIILSHYHTDHYSGFRALGKALAMPRVPEVWVPKIDAPSLDRYLRILTFGAVFQPSRNLLPDRALSSVFCKRRGLLPDIETWFPGSQVREVAEGDRGGCPRGVEGIDAEVLTPVSWALDEHHPLAEPTGRIRAHLRVPHAAGLVERAVNEMLHACTEREDFQQYLRSEDVPEDVLYRFGETIVEAMARPLGQESRGSARESAALRTLLWLDAALPAPGSPRIPKLELSAVDRTWIGRWPQVVADATHLFNVSVRFRGSAGTQFLLTGDADVRLWPKILEKTTGQSFAAVQAPHHGSEENVAWEAYADLDARRFLVSADRFGKWRHPSNRLAGALIESRPPARAARLFCTNRHANCEIGVEGPGACPEADLTAVAVAANSAPRWIIGASVAPAVACPFVVTDAPPELTEFVIHLQNRAAPDSLAERLVDILRRSPRSALPGAFLAVLEAADATDDDWEELRRHLLEFPGRCHFADSRDAARFEDGVRRLQALLARKFR